MSDHSTEQSARPWLLSLDSWAVIAASALIVLIVFGILPRVPW